MGVCRQRMESWLPASRETWISYLQLCLQAQPSDKGVGDVVAPLKAQGTALLGNRNKWRSFIDLIQNDLLCAYYRPSTEPGTTGAITRNWPWPAGAYTVLGQELENNRTVYN